tara:strand:+ start:15870 stop:16058 length:189 start_codon:yes stop_codon:yes gene_type:complete
MSIIAINGKSTVIESEIDLTPSWESTAKMLLAILEGGETLESSQWAKSEVVRMGKIIDKLKA